MVLCGGGLCRVSFIMSIEEGLLMDRSARTETAGIREEERGIRNDRRGRSRISRIDVGR